MKKISIYGFAIITSLVLSACELYEPDDYYYDYDPPAVPGGIVAINGDNRVDLYWDDNYEDDLAGYNVYYSYEYDGNIFCLPLLPPPPSFVQDSSGRPGLFCDILGKKQL